VTNGAFDASSRATLSAMLDDGELEMSDAGFVPGQGHDGWSGHKWLLSYASMIRNFLEGYRIFVRALTALLDAPCSEKDLVKKALETGQRMYLAGEIERREAVCKPILQNALGCYLDQGVLRSAKEIITLDPDFASDEALGRIEQNLAAYLEREGAL
jgi:glycerol-3-phosphate O-acyltransferase